MGHLEKNEARGAGGKGSRVAVLLCGSGYLDGSEIRESVAVLWALSKIGASVRCFAPNSDQWDTVSHYTGKVDPGSARNMMQEAARIARSEVEDLKTFQHADFDALVIPGGYGVAKSLCTFARDGARGSVMPEVKDSLLAIHQAGKPIGAVCIAPALLGLVFRSERLRLTLGATSEAAQELEKLGHQHVVCATSDCVLDEKHKIVSTPAYMDDEASLADVFAGVEKLVQSLGLSRKG